MYLAVYINMHVYDRNDVVVTQFSFKKVSNFNFIIILRSDYDLVNVLGATIIFQLSNQGLYSIAAKSRNVSKPRDWLHNDRITLKFDRHLDSAVVEVPVKFQSDWKSLNPNLGSPGLHETLW